MNHRVISAIVVLVAIFLVVAGGLFAVTVRVASRPAAAPVETAAKPFIPPISHEVGEDMSDCAGCHDSSDGSMAPSHKTYSIRTCRTCHRLEVPAVM